MNGPAEPGDDGRTQIKVTAGEKAFFPGEMRELGMEMHGAFDEIGEASVSSAGRGEIVTFLADQPGRCVACHRAYSLARD